MVEKIRRWETLAAGILLIGIIAAALAVRPPAPTGSGGLESSSPSQAASATASALPQQSAAASVAESEAATISASPSPSPTAEPTSVPTPRPTSVPTAKPTAAPTPAPSTGILPCIPEPTGYAVDSQDSVVAGQVERISIDGQPTGQKVTMSVLYPDGSTVSLGTIYASAPDAGGWTHATFTWTVPASMMPGTASASWTIPCEGTRNFDGSADFTITAP